jgi:hypothetical protein
VPKSTSRFVETSRNGRSPLDAIDRQLVFLPTKANPCGKNSTEIRLLRQGRTQNFVAQNRNTASAGRQKKQQSHRNKEKIGKHNT